MKEDYGQSQKILKLPVPAQVESQALLITNKMQVYYILFDYTEDLLLYMLVIGVADLELQENLLKVK